MRPIFSIFLAFLVTIFLVQFSNKFLGITLSNATFIFYIMFFLFGFLVTWVSNENKVKYSLFYGSIVLFMG